MAATRVRFGAERGIALLELAGAPADTYSYEMMRELQPQRFTSEDAAEGLAACVERAARFRGR